MTSTMTLCPACRHEIAAGVKECPACGVIVSRFRPRSSPRPRPALAAASPAIPAPVKAAPSARRLLGIVALGLLGGLVVTALYWQAKIKPRLAAIEGGGRPLRPAENRPGPEVPAELRAASLAGHFDREADLPGDPVGLGWNGREFVLGNRREPWGFLRARREGDRLHVAKVPVIEPTYHQRIGVNAVTWNGSNWIGITTGAWFQAGDQDVFTVHDPETLQVQRWVPAPPLLGGLAWDGTSYWAGTRKHTADAAGEAYLYRFDASFAVLARHAAPGVGCQGLAWDGTNLYWVDVFSDNLHVLDVGGGEPRVVETVSAGLDYLSGVAFDGDDLWVAEYGEKRLHRLSRSTSASWRKTSSPSPAGVVAVEAATDAAAPGPSPSEAEVAELRRALRSDDSFERMRAEHEMRRRGVPVDYASDQDRTPDRSPDGVGVDSWSIEVRGGDLYASWDIFFGSEFFAGHAPAAGNPFSIPVFARYTFTVTGASLPEPVERAWDAQAGANFLRDQHLASGLGPGRHQVSLFIHVQYVKADGTAQILNHSTVSLSVER